MANPLDDRLQSWIDSVVEGTVISFNAPEAKASGSGVGLYLLDVFQSSAVSTLKPPALQLTLRYLVTTWSEQPRDAHDLLTRLYFAALQIKEFDVERTPPGTDLWRAFGILPQPGFFLRIPLNQERPAPTTKLVRDTIKVQVIPQVPFFGRVVGPGDLPLSNCLVEVPSLGFATHSDREGRFGFSGLSSSGKTHLVLKARGRVFAIDSDLNFPNHAQPMLIRFSSLED